MASFYHNHQLDNWEKKFPAIDEKKVSNFDPSHALDPVYKISRQRIEEQLSMGVFTLYGRSISYELFFSDIHQSVDSEESHPMWSVKMSHMSFLYNLAEIHGTHSLKIKRILQLADGIRIQSTRSFLNFWFPYASSHRVLAILGGLMVSGNDNAAVDRELKTLALQFISKNAHFIFRNLEFELNNNHLERNLAALCLYFSVVAEQERRPYLPIINKGVLRVIETHYTSDGCQVERSPMYQHLGLSSLMIFQISDVLTAEVREKLEILIPKVRHSSWLLTHPDGYVANFNDSWISEIKSLDIPDLYKIDGRHILHEGGYSRLAELGFGNVCILDGGPIGPRWNAGHGHSDFLSVEISMGHERFIIDPGTSSYSAGAQRDLERSWQAHNGPKIAEFEPIKYVGSFRAQKLVEAITVRQSDLAENQIAAKFRVAHAQISRLISMSPEGNFLLTDFWVCERGSLESNTSFLVPKSWQLLRERDTLKFTKNNLTVTLIIYGEEKRVLCTCDTASTQYGELIEAHRITISPEKHDDHRLLSIGIFLGVLPERSTQEEQRFLNEIGVARLI